MAEEKVKILVVDDEVGVLESFKMILGIKDYEVFAFPDGPSAVQSLEKEKYDIAFVDLKLPVGALGGYKGVLAGDTAGLEILKKIKEIDPSVEVIIVTGYATEETQANAITLGALEYLRKPFLMEEIYELVERGLQRRRARARKKEAPPSAPPPAGIH